MATLVTHQDVQALIYEAARDKGGYEPLLDQVMSYLDADRGALQVEDLRQQRVQPGGVFQGYDISDLNTYMEYYSAIEPWTSRFIEKMNTTHASFIRSTDVMHFKDYKETEFYNDWAKPIDLNYTLGCVLQLTDNLSLKVAVQRGGQHEFGKQELDKANRLWPHFNQLLNLEQSAHIWADKQGTYWIIDKNRKIQESNTSNSNIHLADLGIAETNSKLVITNSAVSTTIEHIFKLLQADQSPQPARIRVTEEQYIIVQAYQSSADIVHSPQKQLVIYIKNVSNAELLSQRFGLPIKKARILHGIVQGQTVQQVSSSLHCSVHTARATLKQLFSQFGTGSQTELIQKINQELIASKSTL